MLVSRASTPSDRSRGRRKGRKKKNPKISIGNLRWRMSSIRTFYEAIVILIEAWGRESRKVWILVGVNDPKWQMERKFSFGTAQRENRLNTVSFGIAIRERVWVYNLILKVETHNIYIHYSRNWIMPSGMSFLPCRSINHRISQYPEQIFTAWQRSLAWAINIGKTSK